MNQKKMTGKPSSATTVSLDAFIAGADPVTAPKNGLEKVSVPKKRTEEINNRNRSVGKPLMPSDEVRNKTVQVTLTESEFLALKKRAGRVPVSTFVRDEMKDKDII